METKPRILVVDDEESIRFTFESFLTDEGYEVSVARNYDEAISQVTRQEFDLVFADIILGGKSGIEVIRAIRERDVATPVVMISGAPHIDTLSEALRLGAFDYIPKPVTQETLLRVSKMALKHKALHDEKERYRANLEAIFRSVREGIITVDRDLNILEANEAAEEVCGLSRELISGKSFRNLSAGCTKRCLDALSETLDTKKPVELQRFECCRSKHVVSLCTAPLLDHQGAFSGAVIVVRDETRLADLERDLRERREFQSLIGGSEKMQSIYSLIEDLADIRTTVLITGESGTGKELAAEALHYRGERSAQPLVKVNCSALSENLLESELFGHVKGAFTGAIADKIGRFQKAHGGTLFLDEIGDISPGIQLRLLRVLQEMEFERVGDSTPIRVDVRVIAATNKDLTAKVREGDFREDLYYRLKVVEIHMPPLRERREDIPLLVGHFLKKFTKKLRKEITGVSADFERTFLEYAWPGNVRELEHALEHAFVLCRQNILTVDHLPEQLREFASSHTPHGISPDDERMKIIDILNKMAGNKARAAKLLGMDRKTLYRKMAKYNIPLE